MTDDVKQYIEQLDKAFVEFKAQSDRERESLAKFGTVSDEIRAAVDKSNAEITRLSEKIETAKRAQHERCDDLEEQLNRMAASGTTGSKDDEAHHARQFYARMRGTMPELVEPNVDEYRAYKQAWAQYLRRGENVLTSEMQAALRTGSDPDGGYWAPDEMDSRIVERIRRTSPMRQIADVVTIGTQALELPNDTNDGTLGGWVAEEGARTATATPQVGKQRIVVGEHYAMPEVTQNLLDDAMIDVGAWLEGKIADKMIRTENAAFVNGNGVEKPRGFLDYTTSASNENDSPELTYGQIQHVVTGASGGFKAYSGTAADDAGPLISVIHELNPQYRQGAVWVMNRGTLATVRKLRDANGNFLLDRDFNSPNLFSLLGFPVVEFEDMPAIAADSLSIGFGNFTQGYMVVDRQGTQVLRDPYTNKPYVRFYTTRRVGGDVRNFDAIKLVKFSA